MEIQIEFGGFYGYHDEYIEQRIEADNDWDAEWDIDNIDWQKTFEDYAESWLYRFNSYCDLDLEFVGIDSPKYYNFRTDRIIAKINDEDIERLMECVDYVEFYEFANPRLTSRDGFISFYNGLDDLIERSKNDDDDKAILLGMLCDYKELVNEINEYIHDLEYDIFEINDKLVENE
jgi:hypothetical protein